MTAILFKCKTGEAYEVKITAELLTNNLKNGCFILSEDEISLRMFDAHKNTLVDLELEAENFSLYKFKSEEKIPIGLNLNHFHKILKSIKKKDSLQLFIPSSNPNELGIRTIPKENTRVTTSYIMIQETQNLDIDLPVGYGKPVIVASSDFQKMCKELTSIGCTNIRVSSRAFHIDFIADVNKVMKRTVRLGENDDSSDDEDEEESKSNVYEATFLAERFSRISKIAGLSNTMQIFPGSDKLPLLLRSRIGSIGRISIYIKSKEQTEREMAYSSDSDSEDEYDY